MSNQIQWGPRGEAPSREQGAAYSEEYVRALCLKMRELCAPVDRGLCEAVSEGCDTHEAWMLEVRRLCMELLTPEFWVLAYNLERVGAASELPGWVSHAIDMGELEGFSNKRGTR